MEKLKQDSTSEKDATHSLQLPKHTHRLARVASALALVILLLGLVIGLYGQHRKSNRLDDQSRSLTAQAKQLEASNKKLKSANSVLSKSLQTIANQKTGSSKQTGSVAIVKSSDSSSASSPAVSPTNLCDNASTNSTSDGALIVHGIENLTPSFFGDVASNAATDQVQAVFATVKNLASSDQTYSVFNFGAITDGGVILKPRVYAGPGTGTIWNNSTLTSGGSTCQALLFDAGNTLVTLQMTPPNTSDVYSLPLPSLTN